MRLGRGLENEPCGERWMGLCMFYLERRRLKVSITPFEYLNRYCIEEDKDLFSAAPGGRRQSNRLKL